MINSLLGAGCFDKDKYCKAWADNRQCHTNPYSVIKTCPKSCGVNCGKYFNLAFTASIYDCVEKGLSYRGSKNSCQ